MNYNISVQEYLQKVEERNFDRPDFLRHVLEEAKKLDVKFHFFHHYGFNEINFTPHMNGLPVCVSDSICVSGMVTSAGSTILDKFVSPFSATAVSSIQENGGNILGKTNQDEFGLGLFSTTSAYGVPLNPHDQNRSCGPSGGAAGIIAASPFPLLALASGNITCSASFCGVVGITPTYGLVSRYGLIDATSIDRIGTMGKNVHDASFLLSIIAGNDEKDVITAGRGKYNYRKHLSTQVPGAKIAVPKEYFSSADKYINNAVWQAIEKLDEIGAKYKEVSLPNTKLALAAYYIITSAEASANTAKFYGSGDEQDLIEFSDARGRNLGEEAKRRILLGTAMHNGDYYTKAMKARTIVIKEFKKIFSKFDAIAAPSMPVSPPKLSDVKKLTPIKKYRMEMLNAAPCLAGLPNISVPINVSVNLPAGLQLIGDHFSESRLIEIASAFELAIKKRNEENE